MLKITKHATKIKKVKFAIIVGRKGKSIQFKDENKQTLHWINTIHNQVLVSNMVYDLENGIRS